jgi:hypothetical protein
MLLFLPSTFPPCQFCSLFPIFVTIGREVGPVSLCKYSEIHTISTDC